jgi:hypothetical protein
MLLHVPSTPCSHPSPSSFPTFATCCREDFIPHLHLSPHLRHVIVKKAAVDLVHNALRRQFRGFLQERHALGARVIHGDTEILVESFETMAAVQRLNLSLQLRIPELVDVPFLSARVFLDVPYTFFRRLGSLAC